MKRHKIATSCKGKDKEFKARVAWLRKNGYTFSPSNSYWIKRTPTKDKAIVDMEKILTWPNWAIYISPESEL